MADKACKSSWIICSLIEEKWGRECGLIYLRGKSSTKRQLAIFIGHPVMSVVMICLAG